MPVINGVYLKDFTALPDAVADANIIPIAISGNQVAYRTTVGGIVTDARVTGKLLTGLSVTGGAIASTDSILTAFGKVQNQLNSKVSSVGLTMPSAFSVANSPVTSSGTLAVTAIGLASQYIRGDGALADFPTGGGGGGSSVSYYLNGSVNQGTFGGNVYKEMNKVPIFGAGTDFTINADGYIAQFLTDANDPNLLLIPAGNWNFETYFSASSGGGSPSFYVELYKFDGTTFSLIASSSATPELIAFGTTINPYFSSLAVPETVLLATDRLAIRIYVTHSGRTITLHTENGHLCQIITTFTTGLQSLNGLTKQTQYFAVGSTGTDFNIASSVDTHTFNIPSASASNRGLITTGTQTIAGAKTFNTSATFTTSTTNAINASTTSGTAVSGTSSNYIGLQGSSTSGKGLVATSSTGIGAEINSGSGVGLTVISQSNDIALFYGASSALKASISQAGNITANSFIKSGGTSSQFLKADGSIDSNTYALASALSAYVPYTGATSLVNLGIYNLKANSLYAEGDGSFTGGGLLIKQYVSGTTSITGYNTISSQTSGFFFSASQGGSYKNFLFDATSLTDLTVRSYTLPNASGTLALTSNLNAYLPLTGGTLTGALAGTSATFSDTTDITANNSTAINLVLRGRASDSIGQMEFWNNAKSTRYGYISADSTGMGISSTQAIPLTFGTNTTEKMRITSAGNVGIGTTSPSEKLTLFNGKLALTTDDVTIGGKIYGYNDTSVNLFSGGLKFETRFFNGSSYVYRDVMTINSSGNVGIGTTSPAYPLQVNGLISSNRTSNTDGGLVFGTPANGNYFYGADSGNYIATYTSNAERVRVTSAGNVGIGTTTPTALLQVLGATTLAANTRYLKTHIGGAQSWGANSFEELGLGYSGIRSIYSGSGENWDLAFSTGTSTTFNLGTQPERMRITSGGNVGIGTTSPAYQLQLSTDSAAKPSTNTWTIASDSRVKENITPYTKGLSAIMAINPVNYDYNGKAGFSVIKNNIGVIAQDVLEILPESVSTYQAKLNEDDLEDTELYNFNSHALTYVLINAIKEQQAQIEELKALINK
jgi:hypothetical protein